jgi:hypothetical protein
LCKRCNKNNVTYDLRNQRFPFKPRTKYCDECQKEIDSRKPATTEQLIENYKEVQRILGRRPVADDLHSPNSKYCLGPYKNNFGSWNEFLVSIGVTPIIKPARHDEQSLRKNWIDIKTKRGRVPTVMDLDDRSVSLYTARNYSDHYRSYKNAANAMGDEPNYIISNRKCKSCEHPQHKHKMGIDICLTTNCYCIGFKR